MMNPSDKQSQADSGETEWGRAAVALILSLDLSHWDAIDDPDAWLHTQRESALRHRLGRIPDEAHG